MKVKYLLCYVDGDRRRLTQLVVFKKDSKGWFVWLISPYIWEIIKDVETDMQAIRARLESRNISYEWLDSND